MRFWSPSPTFQACFMKQGGWFKNKYPTYTFLSAKPILPFPTHVWLNKSRVPQKESRGTSTIIQMHCYFHAATHVWVKESRVWGKGRIGVAIGALFLDYPHHFIKKVGEGLQNYNYFSALKIFSLPSNPFNITLLSSWFSLV